MIDGDIFSYKSQAPSIMDAISEWHCNWNWFSCKPPEGFVCEHWKEKNGKNWI